MVKRFCHTCEGHACPTCGGASIAGGGWWDDLKGIASKAYDVVAPIAKGAISQFGGPIGQAAVGFANSQGWGKPKRTRRGGIAASVKARNAVVDRVRKERGISLIEASRAVKREGLWKK